MDILEDKKETDILNDEKKPLISIIIPVYNTSEYLEECLDSLVNQTFEDIEIICINDASTDNSLEILERYAKEDDRIVVINNENNLGQATSRNEAFDIIKGEYLTFIDSDDKIELDAYEKLYDYAKKHGQDMVIFDTVRFNEKGKVWPSILHSRSILGEEVVKTNIIEHKELVYDTGIWNKLIKTDFFKKNNFKFVDNTLYEDLLFSMELFCATDSVGIYPKVKYYWRVRIGDNKSTTQKYAETKNLKDRVFIAKEILKLFSYQKKYECLLDTYYIKLTDIDFLQFINKIDNGDEEFKRIFIEDIKPIVKKFPKSTFKNLNNLDKIKYDLLVNGNIENLSYLVHTEAKTKQKDIKSKKTENKLNKTIQKKDETIKNFKDKTTELTEEIKNLKEENEKLEKNNAKLKKEMKTIKTTKGWIKYKSNNIYKRTIKK